MACSIDSDVEKTVSTPVNKVLYNYGTVKMNTRYQRYASMVL